MKKRIASNIREFFGDRGRLELVAMAYGICCFVALCLLD